MNKEQQELLDEAYENYCMSYKDGHEFYEDEEVKQSFTQDEFIDKCKTDDEFSETWGLKIEERELNHDERFEIYKKVSGRDLQPHISGVNFKKFHFDEYKIPVKLITITYNNKTIESYE